jgi:transketolase
VHVPGHPDEAERLLRSAVPGDGLVYLRLSLESNLAPLAGPNRGWTLLRDGSAGVVIAVGPVADEVLKATQGMDMAVLYAATIRPFDGAALRAVLGRPDVVLVEPYLAGTSAAEASAALADRPHRLLCLGTGRDELRHYGSREEHRAAHGLDAAALRERIADFTGAGHGLAGSAAGGYPPIVVHGRERSHAT